MGRSCIPIYNRESKRIEEEQVFERPLMDIFYGSSLGRLFTRAFLSGKAFSRFLGYLQDRPASRRNIPAFIKKYNIDISELERPLADFRSFNDFFTRKLKAEARPVDKASGILISPGDGRLLVYPIDRDLVVPVKGAAFSLEELLGFREDTGTWQGGICVKLRLAPMDYHRFCYIDDGVHGPINHIDGRLHSVSPLALRHGLKVLQGNDREYVILETKDFGKVCHVDIGALGVGRIYQHFRHGAKFHKGQEKGYFEFGGSTIILLFEPGRAMIDSDIMDYSRRDIETLVRYGSGIGKRP